MKTIKSYTDLEQSKKLAEILSLESADMYWDLLSKDKYAKVNNIGTCLGRTCVYAWSLAALLGVLPQSINKYIESERCQKTFHLNLFRSYYCCVSYDEMPSVNDDNSLYCIGRDNWIDACYEMIIRLYEQNLI